jgi:hypothetical protein
LTVAYYSVGNEHGFQGDSITLAASANSKWLATNSGPLYVKIWDLGTGIAHAELRTDGGTFRRGALPAFPGGPLSLIGFLL